MNEIFSLESLSNLTDEFYENLTKIFLLKLSDKNLMYFQDEIAHIFFIQKKKRF